MSLSKIVDDIALRRHWVDPANRDFDISMVFMGVAGIVVVGAAIYGEVHKNSESNPPAIERKLSNESAPVYRNLSQE